MTNKDEASPRQRVLMEQRWEKVRERCAQGACAPWDHMHAKGCERRTQRTKVTNLVTGAVSEVDLLHTDVKTVMGENKNQAIKLEPVFTAQAEAQKLIFPEQEDTWSRWERGVFEERFDKDQRHVPPPGPSYMPPEPAPARPWWKRVFRRG